MMLFPLRDTPLLAAEFFIIQFDNIITKHPAFDDMNGRLRLNNIIVFFNLHYAFDAVPVGLAFGKYVQLLRSLLIPYAVHLDMGVGREGQLSPR
jgi:hypothetical protein